MENVLVGDLITVRYRGEWFKGLVASIEGKTFMVRFFDDKIPDIVLTNSSFRTIQQKGWVLDKTPNTCQG